jgi:hypothetical protein
MTFFLVYIKSVINRYTVKNRSQFYFGWLFDLPGPGISVSIATGYGLDGPGIESRWGRRDFPHLSRPALGPAQTPVQRVPGISGGKERPGPDPDPSPPSSAVGHERLEQYLYSPYGPYGLYRALVPVQGWPLPLPLFDLLIKITSHQ